MKILFVIRSLYNSGGTERATAVIANELARRNHNVSIVAWEKGESFYHIDEKIEIQYIYKEKKDKRNFIVRDILRRIAIKKIVKTFQPDVAVCVGSRYALVNLPSFCAVPSITWEHFNVNANSYLLHPLARKLAAKKSSKIVTLTNADTENYKKKFGAKQVLTILNPITIDTAEKSPLTQKNVLAIGRFNKQKGFDYLIDIWQQTENRKNGWKLLIVGNGKAKIEKMIAEKIEKYNLAGSVAIIPPTKNVVDLYKNASIYALSSRYEGLPLVLIEATAMGLPIVSFDCETGPRDIILNEKTGFLVPVFDTEKFAQKLDFLMENAEKRKEFSANAIEHSKNFDLQNIVNQWEKLFNEIAK